MESPGQAVVRGTLRAALAARRQLLSSLGHGRRPAPLAQWADEPVRRDEVVLVGDSIVRRLPQTYRSLAGLSIVNHGWGGDTIADVTGRIEVTTRRSPRQVVFQIGTNDVLRGHRAQSAAAAYERLVIDTATTLPDVRIVICALPPISPWRAHAGVVQAFNARLTSIASLAHATYADVFSVLRSPSGTPRPGTTVDGVHLSDRAYADYTSCVEAALTAAESARAPDRG